MKSFGIVALAAMFLAAPALAAHGQYVGGASVTVPGVVGVGAIICEDGVQPGVPPFGIGGVCGVDCTGVNAFCTVTNTSSDAFTICADLDGDGIDETCTGPFVGSGTAPAKVIVNVYVEIPGTTGFISAVDP